MTFMYCSLLEAGHKVPAVVQKSVGGAQALPGPKDLPGGPFQWGMMTDCVVPGLRIKMMIRSCKKDQIYASERLCV